MRWGKCLAVVLALVVVVAAQAGAKDALTFEQQAMTTAKVNPNTDVWTVTVPLSISNTKNLAAVDLPLKFGNPGDGINLLNVDFENGRAHYFDVKVANIDNANKTVMIGLLWIAYNANNPELTTGDGPLATLTFEVTDPRLEEIRIEPTTFSNPDHKVSFIYNEVGASGQLEVKELVPDLVGATVPVHRAPAIPTEWALNQNYPNPFNPVTQIAFALPKDSRVRLEVFNILGQKVTTLVDDNLTAGYHNVSWNADEEASGIYFYRLKTEEFTQTRKMTLLK